MTRGKSEAEAKTAVERLVKIVCRKGDWRELEKISASFKRVAEKAGAFRKVVACGAGAAERKEWEKAFSGAAEWREEPNLIGGTKISVGDVRINNSVSGRLSALKKIFD